MSVLRPSPALAALLALHSLGCGTAWKAPDGDGDGISADGGDCWDALGPVVIDGVTYPVRGEDIYPGAPDQPYDGIDADCAGDDDFDADGDGYVPVEHLTATHGNVRDADGRPWLPERRPEPDCADVDADFDPERGLHAPVGDARPAPAEVSPAQELEVWYDGIDANCDSASDFDADLDGEDSAEAPAADGGVGPDCDDADPAINTGATEACDDVDNDCDGALDGDDPDYDQDTLRTFYADADGDAYGDEADPVESCSAVEGRVLDGGDCDDGDPGINPDAVERCDEGATDEDCDGLVDDADPGVDPATQSEFWADADGDGYGDPVVVGLACAQPEGYAANDGDCDDTDADVSPLGLEVCDGIDNDCDLLFDDDDDDVDLTTGSPFYLDADGDGFGTGATTALACEAPTGFSALDGDCNDSAPAVNPGEAEVCDAADVDEDCSGLADDADPGVAYRAADRWYADDDGDTYGDPADMVERCARPGGRVADATDCDDTRAAVNPAATEVCNDRDDDCDSLLDDSDSSVAYGSGDRWYADTDGDNYGDPAAVTSACDAPTAHVRDNTDCDDGAVGVNPGATEACDAADVDEDCDGLADDADSAATGKVSYYPDSDSDTYGRTADVVLRCNAPTGHATRGGDCDDARAAVNPGASEVCDAADVDEDCDGLADDDDPGVLSAGFSTFYADTDGDGFGDPAAPEAACDAPLEHVTDDTDCDDGEANVYPGAPESCNDGVDNDCDGDLITETDPSSAVVDEVCLLESAALDAAANVEAHPSTVVSEAGFALAGGLLTTGTAPDLVVGGPTAGRAWVVSNLASYTADSASALNLNGVFPLIVTGSVAGRFGAAVAVGDLNDDGQADLIVGEPQGGSGTNRGAVYLFLGPLAASGTLASSAAGDNGASNTNGSFLGTGVAMAGDGDGDGAHDLLITRSTCAGLSSDRRTLISTATGAVLLLRGGAADLIPSSITNTATNVERVYSGLGGCVGAAVGWGDLDGDGLDEALIGEPASTSASTGGAVFAADAGTGSGTTALSTQPAVTLSTSGGNLGIALAAADLDGDGYDDLLAGADGAGVGTGAVYIVEGSATGITTGSVSAAAVAVISGPSAATRFGASVSVVGDIDEDGEVDLLIGEPADSTNAGAAWLVHGPFTGARTVSSAAEVEYTGAATDRVGFSVGPQADYDNDGLLDLVIGAPGDQRSATATGTARVIYGIGG
jgi:hypothetical protein